MYINRENCQNNLLLTQTESGLVRFRLYFSFSSFFLKLIEKNRSENTRTIDQRKLEQFREEIQKTEGNPYTFIMKTGKVPYGLLKDPTQQNRMNLLSVEPFEHTFGPKKKRKKLSFLQKTATDSYEDLFSEVHQRNGLFLIFFFHLFEVKILILKKK